MALVSRMLGRVSLVIWMVAVIAIGGTLEARHLLALPVASIGEVAREASTTLLADAHRELAVWHVLSADCRCSLRVAAHLAERPVVPGTVETILWVTKTSEGPPQHTGAMRVITLTPAELQQRFGAIAAPQMIAIDARGVVRYVGGYSRLKQGELQDTAIIAKLAGGAEQAPLPLFGCAVSEELARRADPLGLDTVAQKGR
jgi:hypothetical protein